MLTESTKLRLEESAKPAFEKFLHIIAEGTTDERIEFSRLTSSQGKFFSDQLESIGRSHKTGIEDLKAHAAIASLTRYMLSIVPASLFKTVPPDFRVLALRTLKNSLGDVAEGDKCVRTFQVILKRIRSYHREGRRATSLDLNSIKHKDLFQKQNRRCNHCLYEFTPDFYRYDGEDDDLPSVSYTLKTDEVSVERVFRKPQLDHIIPVLFGGDEPSNWQILCASCNSGKSDFISSSFGLTTNRSLRLEELFKLSLGKRYSVISETRRSDTPKIIADDKMFYRIYRISNEKLYNAENLRAEYS